MLKGSFGMPVAGSSTSEAPIDLRLSREEFLHLWEGNSALTRETEEFLENITVGNVGVSFMDFFTNWANKNLNLDEDKVQKLRTVIAAPLKWQKGELKRSNLDHDSKMGKLNTAYTELMQNRNKELEASKANHARWQEKWNATLVKDKEKDETIRLLREENEQLLTASAAQDNAKVVSLETENVKLRNTNEQLEGEIVFSRINVAESQKELFDLRHEIFALKEQLEKLVPEKAKLDGQIARHEAEIWKLDSKIAEKSKRIDSLDNERRNLSNNLQALSKDNEALKTSNQRLLQELDTLKQRSGQMESRTDQQAGEVNQQMEVRNAALAQEWDQIVKQAVEEARKEAADSIARLQNELNEKTDEMEHTQRHNSQLQGFFDRSRVESTEQERRVQGLQENVQQLQQKLDEQVRHLAEAKDGSRNLIIGICLLIVCIAVQYGHSYYTY